MSDSEAMAKMPDVFTYFEVLFICDIQKGLVNEL